jgi:transposase
VRGIGQVPSLMIALETGDVKRFPTVGDFSSYGRCVGSERRSNGKKKEAATSRLFALVTGAG